MYVSQFQRIIVKLSFIQRWKALLLFLLTGSSVVAANSDQRPRPVGVFLTDSIEVGKPVFYALSYRHAPSAEVFFADSTYDFAPFELISRKNFTSTTDGRGSLDSALYQLVTFDVQAAQQLKIPVYLFTGRDCTAVFPAEDTIFLKQQNLAVIRNNEKLKAETRFVVLGEEFNFSFVFGVLAGFIAFALSVNWVFGKDISKQWRLLKLQRRHVEYVRSFNRFLRSARDKNNIKDAEKAIFIWKKYLERLEKKPFATYTTREIVDNLPDHELAEALKSMDGIIYGQVKTGGMDTSLEVLKSGATRLYRSRRRQILDSNT